MTADQEAEARESLSEERIDLSKAEMSAIERMNEPLVVKPLDPTKRKAMGLAKETRQEVKSAVEVPEAVEWQESEQFLDDDAPLVVKPLKKKPEA